MRHRGRPLLRDVRRTRAWPVLAVCVIVIATLGFLLRGQARPDGLDSVVDAAMVASFSGHQGVLPWLALPGSTISLIAVSIAIAVGCLIAGRLNGAVLAVTAVPVTAFLDDTVLKHLVDRTHFGQLSFPSGHAASAMTLAAVLGVLCSMARPGRPRPALPALRPWSSPARSRPWWPPGLSACAGTTSPTRWAASPSAREPSLSSPSS